MYKRKRAVDGIYYPTSSRRALRFTFFFTQKSIIWKSCRDLFAQVFFGFSICNGYITAVCFRACLGLPAEVLQRDVAGAFSQLDSEFTQFTKLALTRLGH